MICVTPEMSESALLRMKEFHEKLVELYGQYSIDIEDDTGRRNMLMSSLQEKMFAHEIKNKFPRTSANGKTGEPDILIPELEKELECKLTSKNKSGSWSLQTDYNTLSAKGSLDYLYVLASKNFNEFAVLYFEGLTCEDFHPPAPGSKGKSRMMLNEALKKCTPLLGSVEDKATKYIADSQAVLTSTSATKRQKEKAAARLTHWSSKSKISFHLEGVENAA